MFVATDKGEHNALPCVRDRRREKGQYGDFRPSGRPSHASRCGREALRMLSLCLSVCLPVSLSLSVSDSNYQYIRENKYANFVFL